MINHFVYSIVAFWSPGYIQIATRMNQCDYILGLGRICFFLPDAGYPAELSSMPCRICRIILFFLPDMLDNPVFSCRIPDIWLDMFSEVNISNRMHQRRRVSNEQLKEREREKKFFLRKMNGPKILMYDGQPQANNLWQITGQDCISTNYDLLF